MMRPCSSGQRGGTIGREHSAKTLGPLLRGRRRSVLSLCLAPRVHRLVIPPWV